MVRYICALGQARSPVDCNCCKQTNIIQMSISIPKFQHAELQHRPFLGSHSRQEWQKIVCSWKQVPISIPISIHFFGLWYDLCLHHCFQHQPTNVHRNPKSCQRAPEDPTSAMCSRGKTFPTNWPMGEASTKDCLIGTGLGFLVAILVLGCHFDKRFWKDLKGTSYAMLKQKSRARYTD